jgi:Zn-finger nucleic acid-binding protein
MFQSQPYRLKEDRKMKKLVMLAMVLGLLMLNLLAFAQSNINDPFDKVEKMLCQRGDGVYKEYGTLNKNIIRGGFAYCFATTDPAHRVHRIGDKYTFVCMWKETYDKKKAAGEGRMIVGVWRYTRGYEKWTPASTTTTTCSKKEADAIAELILKELEK